MLLEFALKEYFLGFNGFPKYFLVSTTFTLSTSLKYASSSGLQHKVYATNFSLKQVIFHKVIWIFIIQSKCFFY